MQKANALKLRQNLGSLLRKLSKDGEPILIEKNRKPTAVLIRLEDYQKRFVDKDADDKRKEIVKRIQAMAITLPKGSPTTVEMVRELRYGSTTNN